MFEQLGDPETLDRLARGLGWLAVGLALAGLAVGVLGFLSAPLYLGALAAIVAGAVAARRRHQVQSPVRRPSYDDVRVGLALGSMVVFGLVAAIELLGVLGRLDVVHFVTDAGELMFLANLVLTLGLGMLAGAVHVALGVPEISDRHAPAWLSGLLVVVAAAFFGFALWVGLGGFVGTLLASTRFEWVFYAGAGLLAGQLATFLAVGMPGPYRVAKHVNERFDLASRKRATLSLVGFLAGFYALLWFLIYVTMGSKIAVALPGVDPIALLIPAVLIPEVALILLTVREVRHAEDKPFYDRSMKLTVVGLSAGIAGVFGLMFVVTGTIDYMVFVLLAATGPYGFYEFARVKHLRKMEEKLPDLLRDLAEYWKGGLSMTDAIETLAKGEYGHLTPEVRKMAVQLSWGVPFHDVLDMFAERVNTSLVQRAVSLIHEADRAGGKIADILLAAANDAREIKWLEKERKSNMGIYVAIIYMSFGVFLAVVLIIVSQFLPAIISATQSLGGATTIGNVQIRDLDRSFVVGVFFASAVIQSIGSGMVGGVMGEGEVSAGLKHVFIMVLVSYLTFRLLVGL